LPVEELFRTNNAVTLSFAVSLLRDAGIEPLVVDQHMSIVDGSLGILPRRVLVVSDDADQARRVLDEAGVVADL
jgi:hypothetical protein